MKTLKVAVIGCGNISVRHLDSIIALPQAKLVAVCDIKEDRVNQTAEKYGVKAYADYIKMFEEENLDAVHICLPHYLHVPVSCEAFKRGINVLCEKPMSIKYEDALYAVENAKKHNVKYGIVFQCRYNTASKLVKKRIVDGKLGKVKCGRITLTWHRPEDYYASSDWKGTWDKEGGGVVIDQAIHSLDLANWMIDSSPTEIQSALHNRNHKATMIVDDTAEGLIKYQNGAILSFYAMNNYFVNEPIEIRLLCENGNAIFSYDKAVIEYNNGETEVTEKQDNKLHLSGGKAYWGYNHSEQINQFYNSILGKEELEISGEEALKIQNIICQIYDNDENKMSKSY